MPKPLNGAELIGAYQIGPNCYAVLVKWTDSYVTAMTESLDSPTWYWGHYWTDQKSAEGDWLERASLVLPAGRSGPLAEKRI